MSGAENIPGATGSDADRGNDTRIDTSVEARARRAGWHPKEEFNGDPKDWVDAAEFVRRGESQLPILRENLRKTDARAARLEATAARQSAELQAMAAQLAQANKAVLDIRELLTTAESRAYQRAINDANARMTAAIESGDKDAAKAARADLDTVQAEMQKRADKRVVVDDKNAPPPPTPTVNPTAKAWVDAPEQSWYRENPELKGYADGVFDRLGADPRTKNLTLEEKLDRVSADVQKRFPEHFDADAEPEPPPRRTATDDDAPPRRSRVSTPRSPSANNGQGGRTFDDLPADAKSQFFATERAVNNAIAANGGRGRKVTKEQWARDYFGSETE